MHFHIHQNDLTNHLSVIANCLPARTTNPNGSHLCLEVSDKLHLKAFSNELYVFAEIPANIQKTGIITVPGSLFSNLINSLPKTAIEVYQEEGRLCITTSANGQNINYKLPIYSAESFPNPPQLDQVSYRIDRLKLVNALKKVTFAAGTNQTQPILNGIHIKFNQETIEFAATNGHHMAILNQENPQTSNENNTITSTSELTIPITSANQLVKIISKSKHKNKKCDVLVQGNLIGVILEPSKENREETEEQVTYHFYSCLLNGTYPEYKKLIPKNFITEITVKREDILNSLERIKLFTDQRNIVAVETGEDTLSLSNKEDSESGYGCEKIRAKVQGEQQKVLFNAEYLHGGLRNIDAEEICISISAANGPTVIQPAHDHSFTYLIMPIVLR